MAVILARNAGKRKPCPRNCLLGVALSLAMALVQPAQGAGPSVAPELAAERIATALAEQLAARDAVAGAGATGALRIIKRPFVDDQMAVGGSGAEALSDEILRRLVGRLDRPPSVVSQQDLARRAQELWRAAGRDTARFEAEMAALSKEAGADIELVGTIGYEGGQHIAGYRVVTTGAPRLLASSPRIAVRFPDGGVGESPMTLDAALASAARALLGQAPDLAVIHHQPLRENAQLRTNTGAYLTERLRAALVAAARETRVDGTPLRFQALELGQGRMRAALDTGNPALAATGGEAGAYLLEGAFYVRPSTAELLVSLRDGAGHEALWRGVVQRRLIPDLEGQGGGELPFAVLRDDFPGEYGLTITTNRGVSPSYGVRAGSSPELFEFAARVSRQAVLFCFNAHDQGIVRLLPNDQLRDTTLPAGKKLELPADLKAPDGKRVTFPITLPDEASSSVELIKCFALPEQAVERLPAAITRFDGRGALAVGMAPGQLLDAFRTASDGRLSEASLLIRIERRR